MTNVIAFRIEGRRKASGRDGGGSAAILLFTGIRYVRDIDDEVTEAADPVPSEADGRAEDEADVDATGRLQA